MSFVRPHRVNGAVVPNFYEKTSSAADATSFSSQLAGSREIIRFNEVSTRVEVIDAVTGVYRFNLANPYLVGGFQLLVFWQQDTFSGGDNVQGNGYGLIPDIETAQTSQTFDQDNDPHYVEESSTSIVFYNANKLQPSITLSSGTNNGLMFVVPHTSTPAAAFTRLIVKNQGDNVGIELQGPGDGIQLVTTSGKPVLLQADDDNNLTVRDL